MEKASLLFSRHRREFMCASLAGGNICFIVLAASETLCRITPHSAPGNFGMSIEEVKVTLSRVPLVPLMPHYAEYLW